MANFNELLNAAKGWADLAGKKANEAVEISKLQINNAKLNGELQKAYEKLGAFVYKMEKDNECNEELIKMCVAEIDELMAQMEENTAKIIPMRDKLFAELSKIPHSKINGSLEHHVPGTVNMCFEGIEGESLLLMLDAHGICASSGSACTSGSLDPSHVLLSLGLPHEIAHGSLRLSLGEYNTMEEVDHIIEVVPKVVSYLRNMSPIWEDLETGKKPHLI